MGEDHALLRSEDAVAERGLPNPAPRAASDGRFTKRRRTPFNLDRKSVIARHDDNNDDDSEDEDYYLDSQSPVTASFTPTLVPVHATTTVTITALAAAATTEVDQCQLQGQGSMDGLDTYACQKKSSSSSNDDDQGHSALQTGSEKAGLIVGLTVGVPLLVFLIVLLTLRRKYGRDFTIRSYITRRRRGSFFSRSGNNRKWVPLSDGEAGGAVMSEKPNVPRVTMAVKDLDAGPMETVMKKPSLRSPSKATGSTTAAGSEQEYHGNKPARSPPIARLTIDTRSSGSWGTENERHLLNMMQQTGSEPSRRGHESNVSLSTPSKKRRPGVSFFSWSTAPPTPSSALIANNSNRETIMTDDSEPPRFRSIYSWVNHQTERQRQRGGGGEFEPPPILNRNNLYDHPPYPPTPPIPRRLLSSYMERPKEQERIQSFLESPSPKTVTVEGNRLSQPAKAMVMRSSRHVSLGSISTASTLPVFREHPGDKVDIGQPRVGRVRSSSLQQLLGPYNGI